MLIDCHCRAGPDDGLSGLWDSDAPLRAYLRRAQAAGIARSVLFAAFHSDDAIANHGVARLVASDPQHFYGFAFVHARRDRGRIQGLVRTGVERYGFVGIKSLSQ